MNPQIARAIAPYRLATIAILLASIPALQAADKMKALIVDGQNNHKVWPKSTVMKKQYLEDTGLFELEVARAKFIWSQKGRVFHTALGHDTAAFEGVGLITSFLRGTARAASGKVTQKIPADFPSADKPSARPFKAADAARQSISH